MDLKLEISQDLWGAVQKNYNHENYTSAILDAIHYLTEIIRNKTGLEGDGASLIGQAFGGENPKIRMNKLQTDSEKNIQKGIQEILKGIYIAFRNPRSHEKINDEKKDADYIISFISYLLIGIDKSKGSFDENNFFQRITDPYYVKSKEYATLLVNEIPRRQRYNFAVKLILNKEQIDIYVLSHFMKVLFDKLDEKDTSNLYQVISDTLKTTSKKADIRYILHVCPAQYWRMLDKAVRLRIENLLYIDFEKVVYDATDDSFGEHGALSTWITETHLEQFEDTHQWTYSAIQKLESGDDSQKAYINKYFWEKICNINKNNIDWCLRNYIKKGLQNKDSEIIEKVEAQLIYEKEHPWWQVFQEELKEYPEIKYTEWFF